MRRGEAVAVAVGFTTVVVGFWLCVIPLFRPDVVNLLTLDLAQYFYPKFWYGAAELRHGRLPLWNPYEYCGMPFLAAAQPAVLYLPKNLLFWVLSPPHALHANYVFHMILAGVGQYAYVRWLGVGVPGALVAGMFWAFNLEFAGSLHNPNRVMVLSWVPWVFLSTHWALTQRTVLAAGIAGAAVGVQFMAGYPGFSLCLATFLAVLVAAYAWQTAREGGAVGRVLWTAVMVAGFGFAFAAPQLLPMVELLGLSNRTGLVSEWSTAWETGNWSGFSLSIVLGAPMFDLTIGSGPAVGFAAAALVRDRGVAWTVAMVSIPLLHMAGTLALPLMRLLPGFNLFRAAFLLWNMYVPFFLATLVGLGVERVVRRGERDRVADGIALFLPVAVGSGMVFAWAFKGAMWLWMPWIGLLVGLLAIRTALPGAVVAGLLAAALLGRALGIYPWERGLVGFPQDLPDHALRATILPEVGTGRVFAPVLRRNGQYMLSRLPDAAGYETSLMPARIGRLLEVAGLSDAQTLIKNQPDWDAVLAHRALLDLLAIRLIALPDIPTVAEAEPRIRQAGLVPGPVLPPNLATFRNPRALERAFVVHAVRAVPDAEAAFAAVTQPTFVPATEAIVEGTAPPVQPAPVERPTFVIDTPDRLVLDVHITAPGVLVLLDQWFPGWEAWIDDVPATILPVDYAFRGLAVTAGHHQVEFRYRPRSFWRGVALAVLGAAVVLGACWRRRRIA